MLSKETRIIYSTNIYLLNTYEPNPMLNSVPPFVQFLYHLTGWGYMGIGNYKVLQHCTIPLPWKIQMAI